MIEKLLIATRNEGKLAEFKILLKDLPIELVSLKDLGISHEVMEDGQTFEENAIKKAKEYAKLSGMPTIADDGGLEIDTLGGQPGVHSRRWFGHRMSDRELIDAVMDKMKNVPMVKRTARMRTVIALVIPSNPDIKLFKGKIEVQIAQKPSSKLIPGYPFRSFMYLPRRKKFFVDISFEEQAKFSHRGQAAKELVKYLKIHN